MMTVARVCVLAALVAIVAAFDYSKLGEDAQRKLFHAWMLKFDKNYAEAELSARFATFKANLPVIDAFNAASSKVRGARYGLTKFADLSPAEFKATYLTARMNPISEEEVAQRTLDPSDIPTAIPTSFDWHEKGAVTPVKNQGMCGSCWAFSTTETIESAWFLAGHDLVGLSEQQIVDCDQGRGDEGCDGGDPVTAYQYVMAAGGLETEDSYPYGGYDENCSFAKKDVVASISNWTYVIPPSSHDENVMANVMVAKGPLSICVDAESWQFYVGGIIRVLCGNDLDHCVQLTGYSSEESIFGKTPYWIIRNSWGTDWGYDGYLYVERFEDLCGVADHVTLPIINH